MSCVKIQAPPPLPPLVPGFSLPTFTAPRPAAGLNLCCNIPILSTPPLNIPGLMIPSVALTAINAGIASINAYLAALDLLAIGCPLE